MTIKEGFTPIDPAGLRRSDIIQGFDLRPSGRGSKAVDFSGGDHVEAFRRVSLGDFPAWNEGQETEWRAIEDRDGTGGDDDVLGRLSGLCDERQGRE